MSDEVQNLLIAVLLSFSLSAGWYELRRILANRRDEQQRAAEKTARDAERTADATASETALARHQEWEHGEHEGIREAFERAVAASTGQLKGLLNENLRQSRLLYEQRAADIAELREGYEDHARKLGELERGQAEHGRRIARLERGETPKFNEGSPSQALPEVSGS